MSVFLSKIITELVLPVIYLMFAIAVLYFVWGVAMFVRNADNADKRSDGYSHIIWGVVGLFIMISAIGLFNLIKSILGV